MRSPYNILQELCKVKDQPSHIIYGLPMFTNRLKFILEFLMSKNAQFIVDNFKADVGYFNNVYVPVNGLEHRETLYFMAHHDVYETSFDNANDNSASIAILLTLIEIFNNIENLEYNLVFVFTDSEENGFRGAERFIHQLQFGYFKDQGIKHIINLELCGVGENLWIENTPDAENLFKDINSYKEDNKFFVECPINDAKFIRNKFPFYQNATTIGILNTKDGSLDKSPWNKIHTARDTIDNLSQKDMNNLTMALNNLIIDVNQKN